MGKWWMDKPMRLVQTNLRETDVTMDVEQLVSSLKEFSADVLLFNVGGIVANYPTELKYHYRNPLLKNDLTGNVIQKVHAEGIKFLARFDFSKVNEIYCEQHPEWLYKSVEGRHVNYNGQVHTCVNGIYQQEYSIKILEEVIDKYPVDGVFFNMIGYVTKDYSGNYYGICQCDNCRKLFYEKYGHELPLKEDMDDPVFRKYEAFRNETCRDLFHKISDFIKGRNKDIAICTYTHEGVDVYRKESNTGIDRALPEWNYSASDNVKSALNSWDDKVVSNSAVHFVDYPFRHSAVSPNLTYLRLAQNIANGGWLDYYVIGTLNNQDDRICFNGVKNLYNFHKENERYYTGITPVADVCLIVPGSSTAEYKGIFRMLSESHVLFDAVHSSVLNMSGAFEKIQKYKVLVLPGLNNMSEEHVELVDRYAEAGGMVVATGAASTCDRFGNPLGRVRLKCAGIDSINRIIGKERGTYLRVRNSDKLEIKGFEDLDIIYLDGDMLDCSIGSSAGGYLGYMPACMFGPPEKCYYTAETDIPGVVLNRYGRGKCAFIPWSIGNHYEKLSNHGHHMLFESILNDLLKLEKSLYLDSSPMIEATVHAQKAGKWQLVNLVNLSGQLGTAFLPCIPARDIKIELKTGRSPQRIYTLRGKKPLDFEISENGFTRFIVPEIGLFETVVVE